jgi:ribose transport system substrate-binding protein
LNLKILTSLTTLNNDYEIEQACVAQRKARQLGVELRFVYADNNPVVQSEQLLKAIQSPKESRPDAVIVEPAGGTGLLRVAKAAAEANVAWVVVNWDGSYLAELRRYPVPVFAVSSDQKEIGRIQGRQIAGLLPEGGRVLYIRGPSYSSAAEQRCEGMQETTPANLEIKILKADWTHESAKQAVDSWLRLSHSRSTPIHLVGAQGDSTAMGAREALLEHFSREQLRKLPFLGCDGLPNVGQAWVQRGYLVATVVIPPSIELAMELLVREVRTRLRTPLETFTVSTSFPALGDLSTQLTDY